jgi:hypothetical protein
LESEILGHTRGGKKKNLKSWKSISDTLPINNINALLTEYYIISGK